MMQNVQIRSKIRSSQLQSAAQAWLLSPNPQLLLHHRPPPRPGQAWRRATPLLHQPPPRAALALRRRFPLHRRTSDDDDLSDAYCCCSSSQTPSAADLPQERRPGAVLPQPPLLLCLLRPLLLFLPESTCCCYSIRRIRPCATPQHQASCSLWLNPIDPLSPSLLLNKYMC